MLRTSILALSLAVLGAGCASQRVPPPLASAEAAEAAAVELPLRLGVPEDLGEYLPLLAATGIFAEVAPLAEMSEPDLVLEVWNACETGGGFVPILPLLTLGIVPQVARMDLTSGLAFRAPGGGAVELPCGPEGTLVMGWAAALLNLSPRWTTRPARHPNTAQHLARELARHAPALLSLTGRQEGLAAVP